MRARMTAVAAALALGAVGLALPQAGVVASSRPAAATVASVGTTYPAKSPMVKAEAAALKKFTRTPQPLTADGRESAVAAQESVTAAHSTAADRETPGLAAGESIVADSQASGAPLRDCPNNPDYAPYEWNQYLLICYQVSISGVNIYLPNGTPVFMRCWVGDGGSEQQYGWSSRKWFYITVAPGYPASGISGWIYSMVVGDQIPHSPECTNNILQSYPVNPADGYFTIAPSGGPTSVAGGPDLLDLDFTDVAWGPASVYCHLGGSDGYPYGGAVSNLGTYDIDSDELTIPACGAGNEWVGIIASDGKILYSKNQVSTGSDSSQPSPAPVSTLANDYLEGDSSGYGIFASPNLYVGATIGVDGLGVQNYGTAAVTVDEIALGVTAPDGQRTEYQCTNLSTGAELVNVTIAPGQTIDCDATFSPDSAGIWTYNLDWQGSDGQWRYDFLYVPMTMQIVPLPAPVNDDFADAEDISNVDAFSGDNTYASAQTGEPEHFPGSPPSQSVWYKFTAYGTGRAYVSARDSDGNYVAIAAYTGDAVNDLTSLANWDGSFSDEIAFRVTKGDVYYFAIDDYEVRGEPFTGSYTIAPTTAPPNDSLANAQPLSSGGVYEMDLTNATMEAGEPQILIGQTDSGTVWYTYKPAHDVALTLKGAAGNTNVDFAIYRGTALKSLSFVHNGIIDLGATSDKQTVDLNAGNTYYLLFENDNSPDPASGTPAPGEFDFTATMATLLLPPHITTELPSVLYVRGHYSIQLHAADGKQPYVYRLVRTSPDAQFKLSASGLLTFVPTKTGKSYIEVEVLDSQSPQASSTSTLPVTVARDTTPPSGHITKITTTKGSLEVYWTATDKQSGYDYAQLRYQRISTRGNPPGWVTTGALYGARAALRITMTANYRVEIRLVDKSGNVSPWSAARTVAVPG